MFKAVALAPTELAQRPTALTPLASLTLSRMLSTRRTKLRKSWSCRARSIEGDPKTKDRRTCLRTLSIGSHGPCSRAASPAITDVRHAGPS